MSTKHHVEAIVVGEGDWRIHLTREDAECVRAALVIASGVLGGRSLGPGTSAGRRADRLAEIADDLRRELAARSGVSP